MWWIVIHMAKADTEPSAVLKSAVLVNPTLPAITATANGVLQLTEIDDFISIGITDANLRVLHQPSQRVGRPHLPRAGGQDAPPDARAAPTGRGGTGGGRGAWARVRARSL